MREDEWLKPLSWRQKRDYRGTCHFIDFTCEKTATFWVKAVDDEMLNISKRSDPMWQVVDHRVTYRAVIPKIGHILSPSDHANRMAGEKPQPQFDNLKSKIGFTRPCSGLRIQTYWSNRVNNWRGQLNGENMSWIKQLAYLQLNGGPLCMHLNGGGEQGQITRPAQTKFDSPMIRPPLPIPTHEVFQRQHKWWTWAIKQNIWTESKQSTRSWQMTKSWCRQQPVLPLTMFDLSALQHVSIKIHAIMNKRSHELWHQRFQNYENNFWAGPPTGSQRLLGVWGTGYTCHWRHHLGSRCLIHPPYSPSKPWGCIHTPPP